MTPDPDLPHASQDGDRAVFRYLLLLTESDTPPELGEEVRLGAIRRGPGGHYWIFDGERWLDW